MRRHELPQKLEGKWLWLKSLLNEEQSQVIVRREFTFDSSALDSVVWISAHCNYQLFINGRFVAFGPMPSRSYQSFADHCDVSYYLDGGVNTIAIVASFERRSAALNELPGIWCQLEMDEKIVLKTDHNWKIFNAGFSQHERARRSPLLGFNEYLDFSKCPEVGWKEHSYNDAKWLRPDYCADIDDYPARLEASQYRLNNCEEKDNVLPLYKGSFSLPDGSSFVNFAKIYQGDSDSRLYAAQSFIFSEKSDIIELEIYCDDSYKMFCNNKLVSSLQMGPESKSRAYAAKSLRMRIFPGWNTLLFCQQYRRHSMGFFIRFGGSLNSQRTIKVYQDTVDGAAHCWNIAGPLKVPLSRVSPSINFSRLGSELFDPDKEEINDIAAYLGACKYTINERTLNSNKSVELNGGEYIAFKLEKTRHVFPELTLSGPAGSMVDVTISSSLNRYGVPAINRQSRNTHTLKLSGGEDKWLKFEPSECKYLMISARQGAARIKLANVSYIDFCQSHRNETDFSSSDRELNEIWETGREVLERSTNLMAGNTPCSNKTRYILESYIQSMNMSSCFGDYEYSEQLLRRFAANQYETGEIPALSFNGLRSQFDNLFFFPVWLDWHSRVSGDNSLLVDLRGNLDLLFNYFEALVDSKTNLLVALDDKCQLENSFIGSLADRHGAITAYNVLYCHFLLSASNVYSRCEREESSRLCLEKAYKIAFLIQKKAWARGEKVFCDSFNEKSRSFSKGAMTNFLAIYSGVAFPEFFEDIFRHFFDENDSFSKDPDATASPYFNFFLLETAFAFGKSEWAIRYLKHYWSERMDKVGKTWKYNFSNGKSISPNFVLVREVAGIRVADLGYSTVYFNPAFRSVEDVKMLLPTPYGKIKIEWHVEDGLFEVTIDSTFPLRVMPELPAQILKKTSFHLGQQVSLLDPDGNGQ